MFLLLFALWMIWNGRITWDVVVLGVALSAAISLFAQKVCGWTWRVERQLWAMCGKLAAYFSRLLIEIVKANWAVIRLILSPAGRPEPKLFFFDSGLHTTVGRVVLANSITITPGTYTLGIYGSTLAVHALNADFAQGTPGSPLNRQLVAMEAALAEKEDAQ